MVFGFIKKSRIGIIGYHPTKLPNNRGRHPLIWTLLLGLKELGEHSFPRSILNLEALAIRRGSMTYTKYAEAFMALKNN